MSSIDEIGFGCEVDQILPGNGGDEQERSSRWKTKAAKNADLPPLNVDDFMDRILDGDFEVPE